MANSSVWRSSLARTIAGTVGRRKRRAGAPTPLACDQLVAVAAAPYDDRHQHAVLRDRRFQFVERGGVESLARLIRIGRNRLDGDLADHFLRARNRDGGLAEQRAEAAAQARV